MSWHWLGETFPVARKQFQCVWCGEAIVVGEKHQRYTGTMDGEFQSSRCHMECMKAMNALHTIDKWALEDGFTPGEHPRGCYCDGTCDQHCMKLKAGAVK